MTVWIDGDRSVDGRLPVSDYAFLRGDGCFEVLRSYGGRVFACHDHLERLARSAALLDLPPPELDAITSWVQAAGADAGDGIVRIVVTRGDPRGGEPGRTVVISESLPVVPDGFRFRTVAAPWHAQGRGWSLAGAKTLSYAPNLASTREAQRFGVDDAILVSDDGLVLEGPTFSVGWFSGDVLETPDLDLLILDSITRRHVLRAAQAAGLNINTGRYPLERALGADEVFAMSTIKEVSPVVELDGQTLAPGSQTERLRQVFSRHIREQLDREWGPTG